MVRSAGKSSEELRENGNEISQMPVQKLLAKIHIAKKELALDEETYREILSLNFKVQSSKFLNNNQAVKLVNYFKNKGWVPKSKPKKYDPPAREASAGKPSGDIYSATPAQKRMIEVLWHNLYRGNSEALHLRQFLFNHFKVSDIRFLDKDKAYQAIEALKAMGRKRSGLLGLEAGGNRQAI
jgi:hypothetical protein